MKNQLAVVLGGIGAMAASASSFAAGVVDYSGVATSITGEWTAASGSLIPALVTIAVGFVGVKLVRRFISKV